MIPESYLMALKEIVTRLVDQPIQWVVTGSLGMNLRGMPVEVHDIDLQTDKDGAYALESIFHEHVVTPVRYLASERIRSHLGMLRIGGIKVEIMGDVQKLLEDGSWEEPLQIESYRQWVDAAGLRVPVLPLEYEYTAYLRMGRIEKAEMLRDWLEKREFRAKP